MPPVQVTLQLASSPVCSSTATLKGILNELAMITAWSIDSGIPHAKFLRVPFLELRDNEAAGTPSLFSLVV